MKKNQILSVVTLLCLSSILGACGAEPTSEHEGFSALHEETVQLRASPNTLYGVSPSTDQLISIDTVTGEGTVVGSLGIDVSLAGATADCSGTVWVFSRQADAEDVGLLYTVDLETGAATVQQTYDLSGKPEGVGIEFGPDGKTLYWRAKTFLGILNPDGTITTVSDSLAGSAVNLARSKEGDFYTVQDNRLARLGLDGSTVEDIGPISQGTNISSLSFSDGRLFAHDKGKLYELDKMSGEATEIGSIGYTTPGTAFAIAQGCAPACDDATVEDLWPPNHKMRSVEIAGVHDPDGDDVMITVNSIFQDESVDAQGKGDGNTTPDAIVGSEPMVRAERAGGGDGRVYHLGFTATDSDGNSCEGSVSVCVPHDQGNGSQCVDQGPLYDSTVPPG